MPVCAIQTDDRQLSVVLTDEAAEELKEFLRSAKRPNDATDLDLASKCFRRLQFDCKARHLKRCLTIMFFPASGRSIILNQSSQAG